MTETAPTGTVTFLFTDIEGSTRLWEQFPEAMKSVLARHDLILREAIAANQGHIVKTTGDGCHAVFETALDAVIAALMAQKEFHADPWREIQPQALRVRMGEHSGEAEARAGDYYGPALNRAARLMSVGHGGQILISAVTAELVRDRLPAKTELMDLGEHRLKDLVRPEHIFQLVHPALAPNFPPLKSVDAYPNNLPVQITSFIGREREMAESKRLLTSARLVTLIGSGGTGKTRLALQVAADMLPIFSDGAWLVELAALTDGSQVLPEVAGVFELGAIVSPSLEHTLTEYLRGKSLLIVLDNCEHLIDACAQLVDHLLRACPHVKILASSREGLGIAGEVAYRVPSLALPDLEETSLEKVRQSEAVQLFVERASATNPHFALNAGNAGAVAQVCQRLDGIPLALELAAARTRLFPVEQIAERLNDRFRLLTGGSRTALPRQQTLRALIDWSYELLPEPERALLRQLSIFMNGWTFEAAEAVCADTDVLSLLEQLVNKSLVVMEENQGQARYHMLETIRQYAREKLIDAGEAAKMRDRHFDYFLRLSEQAEAGLRSREVFAWIDRLLPDYDNLSTAIEWGHAQRSEDALILIGNLIFFWGFRTDDQRQIVRWLNDLLKQADGLAQGGSLSHRGRLALARGLTTSGMLFMGQGDYPAAFDAFSRAVVCEREFGDRFWLGIALGQEVVTRFWLGLSSGLETGPALMKENMDDHWLAAAEESLALLRGLDGNRWLLAALPSLAAIENQMGNPARAQQFRQEIRLHLDEVDHPLFISGFIALGLQARFEGHSAEARAFFRKGLKLAQRIKSRFFIILFESELAHLDRVDGDFQQAKASYRKLIWKWKDFGQMAAVANQLECFAFIARSEGALQRAVRLLGVAEGIRASIQAPMLNFERVEYERTLSALHEQMDTAAFASAWGEGQGMSLEHAIRYAVEPEGSFEPAAE